MVTYLPPKEGFWKKLANACKSTFLPFQYGPDKQAENLTRQLAAHREFETERRELELIKLKAQYHRDIQQQDWQSTQNWLNRQFQGQENDKTRQLQAAIVAYTKQWDYQILHQRMDFDLLLQQERKAIDLELLQQTHLNQIALSLLNTQRAKETEEYRRILSTFPLRSAPSIFIEDLETRKNKGERFPLLITISPPDIDFEPFQVHKSGLPQMEKSLNEAMRIFFHENYSKQDKERPIEFVGGLWDSNKYHSEAAIKNLHYLMPAVPTLVINSEVHGDLMNLHTGVWRAEEEYNVTPIFSGFNVAEFLFEICKQEAAEWGNEREDLLSKLDEERVKEIAGDKEVNWQLLQEERIIRTSDKNFTNRYRPTRRAFKELEKHLSLLHQLIAGLVADEYFFINYQLPPKLPTLLPELLQGSTQEEQEDLEFFVFSHYINFGEDLAKFGNPLAADFILDLAVYMMGLSNFKLTMLLTKASIYIWLVQQELPAEKQDLLTAMCLQIRPYMAKAELAFLKKLGSCLYFLKEMEEYDWIMQVWNETTEQQRQIIKQIQELDATELERQQELKAAESKRQEEAKQQQAEEEGRKKLGDSVFIETVTVDKDAKIIKRQIQEVRQKVVQLPNDVELELVYIPSGEFLMGAAENENGAEKTEKPQHLVYVTHFYMAATPVTQAQWEAIMGSNPSTHKYPNNPVENVSWEDTQVFCQKLNLILLDNELIWERVLDFCEKLNLSKLNNGLREYLLHCEMSLGNEWRKHIFRLPSEAEWEYACRAGTITPFSCGMTIITGLANYGTGLTTEVKRFSRNLYGLYDMHGNVSEWCEDLWHDNYNDAPINGSAWLEGGVAKQRVHRGGNFTDKLLKIRSACRAFSHQTDTKNSAIGFRIVLPIVNSADN
ncbi:formylglycine-generating enzyme family protein [Nostoc sp.]